MAEDFISEIYEKADMIYAYKRCVEYLTLKNMSEFSKTWTAYGNKLLKVVGDLKRFDFDAAERLSGIINAVLANCKDRVYVIELIENEMLPILYQYMDYYGGIDVVEGQWRIKSSKVGYLTLYNVAEQKHLHSLNDPMWEAKNQAQALYKGKYDTVLIFGAGLGYLARAFWEISEKSVDIFIFENDPNIVEYAKSYGVVDSVPEDNIHYIVDENKDDLYISFIETYAKYENKVLAISDWMLDIYDGIVREQLENVSLNIWTSISFANNYDVNYWRNQHKFVGEVSEFENAYGGKDHIVVAAGPSLDDYIDYIRENKGKKIIIAVNTVLKRLLKEGIKPDFVCLVDPTKGVFKHIDGVEDQTGDIPLIVDSCAYWKFIDVYQGPVYRLFTYIYSVAIEEAKKLDQKVHNVGTTVTCLAIEIAIIMGAKRIELIGADLSFPGDIHYAGSSSKRVTSRYQDDIYVKSVDGAMVKTVNTFDIFRKSIEGQILRNPKIEFVNLSEHGALISGTVCGIWKDHTVESILGNIDVISEENYTSLIRIEGVLADVNNNAEAYPKIFANIKLNSECSMSEMDAVVKVIVNWHDYAIEIGNIKTAIYLDSMLLTLDCNPDSVFRICNDFENALKDKNEALYDWKNQYYIYSQLVGKIGKRISEDDFCNVKTVLLSLKNNIVDELSSKISSDHLCPISSENARDVIYIILDHISSNINQEGCEGLDYAKKCIDEGKQILVINTSERYTISGKFPIYNEIERDNCDDEFEAEFIEYKGKKLPYFQCESYMPDIEIISVLLGNIRNTVPSKIVSYSNDSLLVWIIEKIASVEYR